MTQDKKKKKTRTKRTLSKRECLVAKIGSRTRWFPFFFSSLFLALSFPVTNSISPSATSLQLAKSTTYSAESSNHRDAYGMRSSPPTRQRRVKTRTTQRASDGGCLLAAQRGGRPTARSSQGPGSWPHRLLDFTGSLYPDLRGRAPCRNPKSNRWRGTGGSGSWRSPPRRRDDITGVTEKREAWWLGLDFGWIF